MSDFEKGIIGKSLPQKDKLLAYGFIESQGKLIYTGEILNQFSLTVSVDETGNVETSLMEKELGEPYVLYKINGAVGEFVGKTRIAVEKVLTDIKKECFSPYVYKENCTLKLIRHISETYGDELEFLWEKFPDNSIVRRKDNKKWYAVFGSITPDKIGLKGEERIEIAVIRGSEEMIDGKNVFPAYHMNKKSWITMPLGKSCDFELLIKNVKNSYELAGLSH